jgi:uncharacterized protein Yka (UPF0111/DUF47 family)
VKRGKARWFLPENGDVLGLLGAQIDVTTRGMDAFAGWGGGDIALGEVVRAAEHEADERKRDLIEAVRESFTTPLEPEDLYELSRGLDDVINGAKNTVREAEALSMTPNKPMAEMCDLLAEGVRHLGAAFAALGHDAAVANTEAAAAVKSQRNLERSYRGAMAKLINKDDLHDVVGRQELYRRLTRISDALIAVADRVMYATVKEL